MANGGNEELFDGHSLDGWAHVGEGSFRVVDEYLRTEGGMGLLWYPAKRFCDCEVRTIFRAHSRSANSGVFVRITELPADAWFAVHHGYEVQILADGDPWHRTGCIYTMSTVDEPRDRRPGEWNEMTVELDGNQIRVILNGVLVTDFSSDAAVPPRASETEPSREPRPNAGYIGLQNHDAESVVDFREVVVRYSMH